MPSRKIWTIVIACVVVASAIIAAIGFERWADSEHVVVDGGVVLSRTADSLTVRCLSPDVRLTINDFSGKVTFTNCFVESTLEGFDGEVARNGTAISFDTPARSGDYRLIAPEKSNFSFAVMGDSHGQSNILEKGLNMTQGCDFVIHCGDLTPSGRPAEFAAIEETLNSSRVPIFTTPGNHDVKTNGSSNYCSRFGPTRFAFDYGGVRFAFVDSSDLDISPEEISWLKNTFIGAEGKVIVTHAPCYDPFEGNHTLDAPSCERLEQFASEDNVTTVFSGHIHAYYLLSVESTDFVITGGTGGSLTAGTYHWVRVNVTTYGFSYQKVDIDVNSTVPSLLTVMGHGVTSNLTMDDLAAMRQIEGVSSYQNQLWNVGGEGLYRGVTVSSLLDLVGGIGEGEVLKVTASDGYYQEFGYGNVNPNSTWLALQGTMILALEYNALGLPDWTEGPRIAMLPSDGLYDNSDCEQTSYPGQGYAIYPSAGARWVKNVVSIEVEG
jgi:predicted phosphodiesterase